LLHGKANFLYAQFKKDRDMRIAKEIISLCNKISCANQPDMQCGANALLVRIYAYLGQTDEAKRLANGLPSFEIGRELLMAECLQGAEKADEYRYLIERFQGKIQLYQKRLKSMEI